MEVPFKSFTIAFCAAETKGVNRPGATGKPPYWIDYSLNPKLLDGISFFDCQFG
jgi:hypothetical protein